MIVLAEGAAHVASVFDELSLGALLIHGIGLDEIIERYKAHKQTQASKSKEQAITSALALGSMDAVMKNPGVMSQFNSAFSSKNKDRTERYSLLAKWVAFIFTFAAMALMSFHSSNAGQGEVATDEWRKWTYFIFAILGFSSTVLLYRLSDKMKAVTKALDNSQLRDFDVHN